MQLPQVASVQTVLQKDQEPYSATEMTISGWPSSSNGLLPAQRESTMLDVRKLCCSDLNISQGGKSDLMKHKQGKKHEEYESAVNSRILKFHIKFRNF